MHKKDSPYILLGNSIAVINKVQNTTDGGLRVTLDIPSSDVELAQSLLKLAVENSSVIVQFLKND